MSSPHTLLLEDDWDLHVDPAGNLPVSYGGYSVAQNVANAFRLFTEDAWFGDGVTTQRDGSVFKGMTGRFGDYSGNQANAPAEGDLTVKEWKKVLIQEDAEQAAEYRADVEDFIQKIKG